jgi:hypothetical protein
VGSTVHLPLAHKTLLHQRRQQTMYGFRRLTAVGRHLRQVHLTLAQHPVDQLPLGIGQSQNVRRTETHCIPPICIGQQHTSADPQMHRLLGGIQRFQRQVDTMRAQLRQACKQRCGVPAPCHSDFGVRHVAIALYIDTAPRHAICEAQIGETQTHTIGCDTARLQQHALAPAWQGDHGVCPDWQALTHQIGHIQAHTTC